ncbi:MAG: AzlC family ABC transporter permease [Roseovarius sp.]
MPEQTTKSAWLQGVRDGSPFILVMIPFSTLFGVVATESGLNVFEALTFSIVVLAGAAQFTALQMMNENAPTLIVIATALAVNLRMAMYAAAMTPYFSGAPFWQRAVLTYFCVDPSYAASVVKFEDNPNWPMPHKVAYFIGVASPICPFWYGGTLLGAWFGTAIPQELALDFAIPITFLALIMPMIRSGAHVAAAFVAIVVSLLCVSLPFSMHILVGGFCGMITGAAIEKRMARAGATP